MADILKQLVSFLMQGIHIYSKNTHTLSDERTLRLSNANASKCEACTVNIQLKTIYKIINEKQMLVNIYQEYLQAFKFSRVSVDTRENSNACKHSMESYYYFFFVFTSKM